MRSVGVRYGPSWSARVTCCSISYGILLIHLYAGELLWDVPLPTDQKERGRLLLQLTREGRLPAIPVNTDPLFIHGLIRECTRADPSQRPTFATIASALFSDNSGAGHRRGTSRASTPSGGAPAGVAATAKPAKARRDAPQHRSGSASGGGVTPGSAGVTRPLLALSPGNSAGTGTVSPANSLPPPVALTSPPAAHVVSARFGGGGDGAGSLVPVPPTAPPVRGGGICGDVRVCMLLCVVMWPYVVVCA